MKAPLPLSRFLSRLIWLSLLPLILASVWLGYLHVKHEHRNLEEHSLHLAGKVSDAVDRFLQTRMAALQILSGSPLLGDPGRLEVFYRRALEFQEEFGGHIILADAALQMRLNTRVPFGTPLMRLPHPLESAVAPAIFASGKRQVSDLVQGPVIGKPLIAISVPVLRAGKPPQLLLATYDVAQLEVLFDNVLLPEGRELRLLDSAGRIIAQRGSPDASDSVRRFVVHSSEAHWTAELAVSAAAFQAPLITVATESLIYVLIAIVIGGFGGFWSSRRLTREVRALSGESTPAQGVSSIREIEAVRQLNEIQHRQLQESERRYRSLFENNHSTMLLIDPEDGRIVDANPAAEIFYGWPRDILTTKRIAQINTLPPDELARQKQQARETRRNIFHYRHRLANGSIRDVEVHSGPVRIDDRELLYSIVIDETERLTAEHALQGALTAAARFRDALEQVDAYVYMKDQESRYFYANQLSLNVLDVSIETLIGSPPERFFSPEVAAGIRASDRRVLAGERIAEEVEYLMPDGRHHVFWEVKSPIMIAHEDGRKEVWGVSGISTDITAYKVLQQDLAFKNQRSRILLELPQLADQLDEATFMQRGLEMAEILTNSQISFIHFVNPDQDTIELVTWSHRTLESYCHAAFDRHYSVSQAGIWAEALRQKQPVVYNDYASAPDRHGLPAGHAALERLISLPIIEDGKVVMLAGIGNKPLAYTQVDTETLQLIANEIWRLVQGRRNRMKIERFNRMIERSLNEIFSIDIETLKFVDANRGACANIGYSVEELRGMTPLDIKPQMTPESFAQLIEPLRTGEKKIVHFTTPHRRKNGTEYLAEVNIELTDDVHPLFIAVARDITERKRYEQELSASLNEQKALNKKLEATQHQLLQSEKLASIGQLAAGVAHELNNPIGFVSSNLNTLDGYLRDLFAIADAYARIEADASSCCPELDAVVKLKQEKDYDFLRADIFQLTEESRDGLSRVAKIVRDLKDFSRAGESAMQWASLHQGLDSTLNIVWNELKYKCTVTKQYGDLPDVWCEPSQLNQVFMNLLVNAGHAIPDKGEITITTGTRDEEVFVSIADTGSGIAPENLTRIFDPFFTTKPVGKGTGLGLSLAYGIIQKHHGRIEVQSNVGQGTTFTVWLPVKPPKRENTAVPPAPILEQP
jgi:PAS domain S-box-containing protein